MCTFTQDTRTYVRYTRAHPSSASFTSRPCVSLVTGVTGPRGYRPTELRPLDVGGRPDGGDRRFFNGGNYLGGIGKIGRNVRFPYRESTTTDAPAADGETFAKRIRVRGSDVWYTLSVFTIGLRALSVPVDARLCFAKGADQNGARLVR